MEAFVVNCLSKLHLEVLFVAIPVSLLQINSRMFTRRFRFIASCETQANVSKLESIHLHSADQT